MQLVIAEPDSDRGIDGIARWHNSSVARAGCTVAAWIAQCSVAVTGAGREKGATIDCEQPLLPLHAPPRATSAAYRRLYDALCPSWCAGVGARGAVFTDRWGRLRITYLRFLWSWRGVWEGLREHRGASAIAYSFLSKAWDAHYFTDSLPSLSARRKAPRRAQRCPGERITFAIAARFCRSTTHVLARTTPLGWAEDGCSQLVTAVLGCVIG